MISTLVEFKAGRGGALLPAEAFAAERARLWDALRVVALEAPETVGGVVVVTDFWRVGTSGLHPKLWAFDVRTGVGQARGTFRGAVDVPFSDQVAVCDRWFARVRARVGPDFDVLFGDEQHLNHAHVELDQIKRARAYTR